MDVVHSHFILNTLNSVHLRIWGVRVVKETRKRRGRGGGEGRRMRREGKGERGRKRREASISPKYGGNKTSVPSPPKFQPAIFCISLGIKL